MSTETEDQTRLHRAKQAIAHYHAAEAEARKALAQSEQSTKRAREKCEELFIACENREVKRRLANCNQTTK